MENTSFIAYTLSPLGRLLTAWSKYVSFRTTNQYFSLGSLFLWAQTAAQAGSAPGSVAAPGSGLAAPLSKREEMQVHLQAPVPSAVPRAGSSGSNTSKMKLPGSEGGILISEKQAKAPLRENTLI